jgi:hypothetical protein
MWAVDARPARKHHPRHCIDMIFWIRQIFASGVANITQTENAILPTENAAAGIVVVEVNQRC